MLREGQQYHIAGDFALNSRFSQIVDAYRKGGFEMLKKVFDDAKYLEEITGLDVLHKETEAILEAVDWDEEDDF